MIKTIKNNEYIIVGSTSFLHKYTKHEALQVYIYLQNIC